MMKHVFVTGAPGWLGNRLVKALAEGFDDFPLLPRAETIRCLVLPGLDVEYLWQFSNVTLVKGDVTKPETVHRAITGCDTVIHCVGIIHPKTVAEFYRINTDGTKYVLEEAIRSGANRFIFVSSNSPMGTNRSRDCFMTEEDPYRPYKHYGRSKMLAEQLVNQAYKTGRIETVILRPCWYYGPGQPARQLEFFTMIKKGHPPLFGDGHNLRSMSYVDNVVQGLILAATVEGAKGQTYWVADERPYQTIQIYQTIAELLGIKQLRCMRIPRFMCKVFEIADTILQALGIYYAKIHVAGEMNKNITCSIEKAKQELGYNPHISLKEGMKRSLEWCKRNGHEF